MARLLTLSLPGIDEVIGLVEITRLAEGYDTVIVDTAPTGHTLRLLAAPALLGRVAGLLDNLQSHHRAVVSALRGSYREDADDSLIAELEREGEGLAAMLRDPERSDVSWVTLPEPMALEETSDALAALAAVRIPVRRLIVNRITPAPPAPASRCEWCAARRRFEARALIPVAGRLAGPELLALPELPREPRGATALRAAGGLITPWQAPAATPPVPHRVRAQLDRPPEGGSHEKGRVRRKELRGTASWLLFGGKGGVGKTTCAAAAALDLAADRRVLLISTDPAHSLGDVFGAVFGDVPRAVPGGPARLQVREIDAAVEMERFRRKYLAAVDQTFARIARSAGGDEAAFRDLIDLAPPGIDEVIAIAEVAEALADATAHHDVIVTDTAPTGHALRLLQTPALLREWTQALMSILLKYHEIVGAGTLAALLVQLSKRLRGLQEVLGDPAKARFVIVTRAAALPAAESQGLMASLQALGIAVGAVVVNAVGAGDCPRCLEARRVQSEEIARLRSVHAGGAYAIIEAPAEVPPPHGVAALKHWRTSWRHIS